jgi:hypothetical protein
LLPFHSFRFSIALMPRLPALPWESKFYQGKLSISSLRALNLSTHSAGALYEAFAPAEARRILSRASWLNMVAIEIGVLRGQCLDRRIDDPKRLISEIAAWEKQRNAAHARIKWMFTTEKARAKMGRAYPVTSKES